MISNTDEVQLIFFSYILTENADIKYLRRYGFHGQTERETFKKLSVIIYEDLQPDINRVCNGDMSPILYSHPISEFLTRYITQILHIYYYSLVTKMIILILTLCS